MRILSVLWGWGSSLGWLFCLLGAVMGFVTVACCLCALLVTACSTGSESSPAGTAGPGTSGTDDPSPTAGREPVMVFRDLHQRRHELVGKTVTVHGRVLFRLLCPPPGSTASQCTALAFLADTATKELVPYEKTDLLQLFKDGRGIGCSASTTSGLSCRGFRHGAGYDITGALRRPFGDVVLEVVRATPR